MYIFTLVSKYFGIQILKQNPRPSPAPWPTPAARPGLGSSGRSTDRLMIIVYTVVPGPAWPIDNYNNIIISYIYFFLPFLVLHYIVFFTIESFNLGTMYIIICNDDARYAIFCEFSQESNKCK